MFSYAFITCLVYDMFMLSYLQHIDALKKENFNIKLKVHFLEERLAQLAPDQIDAALKQNINLKIEVQQRGLEMKKLKKQTCYDYDTIYPNEASAVVVEDESARARGGSGGYHRSN